MRGGPAGDLYIFLSLGSHPFFQRDGADLHCRVPISMVTAALGGEFEVPTIDGGKTRVKVPEGTQSGRRFRLQGKGMPVLRSRQTGDMYVQVVVETPQKLTKKQRELLNEFEKLSSKDTHPESAGFFGKVREFLGGPRGLGLSDLALDPRQRGIYRLMSQNRNHLRSVNPDAAASPASPRKEDRAADPSVRAASVARSSARSRTRDSRRIKQTFEQDRDEEAQVDREP